MTSQERSLVSRLRSVLPRGNSLPDAEWKRRHRFLLVVLWAQVFALPLFGFLQDFSVPDCLMWLGILGAFAVVLTLARNTRAQWVSGLMSVALLTCSVVLIAFWHGQIEAHFHFFVMIVLLTLYEEWLPFLIAAAYVALHHGIGGVIAPAEVYDHESAIDHPWRWAAIHAGFVAAAGAAALVAWRLNEDVRDERERTTERALAAEHALAVSARELQRSNADLARSNAELEQFAYVASHDLSEPLRTIHGFMRLLEQRYGDDLDDRGRAFVAHAVDGADRMQRLIDGLLAYSKVGRSPAACDRVELADLVAEVLEGLEARIQETRAIVTVGPLPAVRGDADLLAQALQNLLSNALKFARPDEPPRVEVEARRQGGRWCLTVADHGIGIAPDARAEVFRMFHRLHGYDDYEGAGIGLAIVQRVVEHGGGEVRVEETPGGGATFALTLADAPPAAVEPELAPA